jgi:hypothetical protein
MKEVNRISLNELILKIENFSAGNEDGLMIVSLILLTYMNL